MQVGSLEYVPVVRTSTAHGSEKHGKLQPTEAVIIASNKIQYVTQKIIINKIQ